MFPVKHFLRNTGTPILIEHIWTTATVTRTNEEADTLIILHAKNFDGGSTPLVFSTDTDVFLQLAQLYPRISETKFIILGRKTSVGNTKVYSSIVELRPKSLQL